jgi:hypothetical protein
MRYKTVVSIPVTDIGAMTDQILFDRLTYIDRLKRGGIGDDQARAHAEAMDAALRESVATRADIDAIKLALAGVEMAVNDMTIRLGGTVALGVAALAAFKFFEH